LLFQLKLGLINEAISDVCGLATGHAVDIEFKSLHNGFSGLKV
jgi:hypothetical protein